MPCCPAPAPQNATLPALIMGSGGIIGSPGKKPVKRPLPPGIAVAVVSATPVSVIVGALTACANADGAAGSSSEPATRTDANAARVGRFMAAPLGALRWLGR